MTTTEDLWKADDKVCQKIKKIFRKFPWALKDGWSAGRSLGQKTFGFLFAFILYLPVCFAALLYESVFGDS